MDLAFLAAEHFGIERHEAKGIAQEVARAVVRWRDVAMELGASEMECERMATAFEHDDLAAAR
jgi:serine/threonine-protein kinase HipA